MSKTSHLEKKEMILKIFFIHGCTKQKEKPVTYYMCRKLDSVISPSIEPQIYETT